MVMARIARSLRTPASLRRSLLASAAVVVAASVLASGALAAEGEPVPSSGSGATACPSPNPPDELTLIAGTPQSATLGAAFATNLQVAFANSNGCPLTRTVAGTSVTFSAPLVGASGLFSSSGSNTATVGSNAEGVAAAPPLSADDTAGGYSVTASSAYGSLSFSLTNAVAKVSQSACGSTPASVSGTPAKLTLGVGATESTRVGTHFPIRLAATVTDAEKDPVAATQVTFSAPAHGASGRFATRSGRSDRNTVRVRTDACGIAVAPAFVANGKPGGYIVKASVAHVGPAAFALVNEAR
jgi:hypothetical protein